MVRLPIEVDEARLPRDGVLALASFVPADAEALVELDRDPEHRRRFELPDVFVASVEHSRRVIEAWKWARADGQRYAFAVRLMASAGAAADAPGGELVGGVELWPRTRRTANLSYWVHPPHRARGYGRRAASLACAWARDQTPLERLEILADPDNVASRRVALASGFAPSGVRGGRVLHVLELRRDP